MSLVIPPKQKFVSKLSLATTIIREMPTASTNDVIERLQKELGLGEATARSYCYLIRSKDNTTDGITPRRQELISKSRRDAASTKTDKSFDDIMSSPMVAQRSDNRKVVSESRTWTIRTEYADAD